MNTTVYLIRHSKKIAKEILDNSNNNENYQTRREKIILSIEGEKRAQKLASKKEFSDVDEIYSSNYARTIQTAKYLAELRKKQIHIDDRFNERKFGIKSDNEDISLKQYYDENIKNEQGETRKEVTTRMEEAFWDVINTNKGKKIAIFTHEASMTFLLMKWCKLEYITEDKKKCLSFKNKIIVDKIFDAPEVFKITISENNNIKSIENILV